MQAYYQVYHHTSRQPIYNCYATRHEIQSPQHNIRNIKAKWKCTNQNRESLSSVSRKVQERKHTAAFENIKPLRSHQGQTNMSVQHSSYQKQRNAYFMTMLKECRMKNEVYSLNGAHAPEFSCKAVINSTMMKPFPSANDIEAVLFDVDGTLCDSDPLHYLAFRDMLQEVGFQGGVPITEEFFSKNISGKHNDDIGAMLFPHWDESQRKKFLDDKEALFRRMAPQHLKAVKGLHKLCKWIESHGIRRAAVTNAPRENAELMISILDLTDFFELVIVGSECERAKPFPDPYLKALEYFKIPSDKAFAIEDSPSGLKAAVAAGLPVLGVTTRNPGQGLLEAGATFLIKDFEDSNLWNALESRNAVKFRNAC